MVRRRDGRRRRRQISSPAVSSTLATLAIYLISLPSSISGVAITAAVAATPQQHQPGDVDVGVDVGQARRGGGIGGKGQQVPTIDSSSWVESNGEEVLRVSERRLGEQAGGGGSSSISVTNTAARAPGAVARGEVDGGDGACSTSDGGGRDDSSSGSGRHKDRLAAQTVGVPVPVPVPHPQDPSFQRPVSSGSGSMETIGGTLPDVLVDSAWCLGEEDCVRPPALEGADDGDRKQGPPPDGLLDRRRAGRSTKNTIGGTVPDVLEDSAWCVGEEEDCVRPSAEEGADDDTDQKEAVAGGLDGGGACSSTAAVYGGGVSAPLVDLAPAPAAPAGRGDGGRGRAAEATSSASAAAAGGEDDGVLVGDGEALERPTSKAARGASDRHAGQGAMDASAAAATASSADSSDPGATEVRKHPRLDGNDALREATASVYPDPRPAPPKQQSAPTIATPPAVATEQTSPQERRGPLVKGEGANTNTKHDEGGGADRRDSERRNRGGGAGCRARKGKGPRGRDLSTEATEELGGEKEEEEKAFEGVAAVDQGRFRPSWRTFASALLVCALVFGTYLRGTSLSWVPLPFFGRDPREGWAIDLDSAIANARSRASSFCSGRASVFSEDPVDDADLPDLISDHEGDDGGGGGSDGDGEVPLMWDMRPKPDAYLVFHPVLGVVPAGAVRAWGSGGDGCGGGWGGGKAGRNGCTAVAGAAINGGPGPEEPDCSPGCDRAGGKVSKAVGDGKGKRLPPVRNTDEWFEWVASREAAAAAAVAAVAKAPYEAAAGAAAAIVPAEETVPNSIPPDGAGAGAAPPDEAGEVGARAAVAKEVPGGGGAIGGGSERERSGGGGRLRTTSTPEETVGMEKASSSLSHTPAAISLQFGVGNGTVGNACNGGGGGEGSADGGSARPGGSADNGSSSCDESLSFGSGCPSDDGRNVRVDDYSARLSSEQPPAVTAAYHVS